MAPCSAAGVVITGSTLSSRLFVAPSVGLLMAVSAGAIWASESFPITGLIVKDLALWEEGQEALMSQGGPSVRQVGVSGSSSSVRARSPTRDAYVSMDPGGTVVFRAWLVPGVRRHG